ncbi:MAG: hypothetical protein AB8B71_05025 [Paracoccaceae bacterium]
MISILALSACGDPVPTAEQFIPDYQGVQTQLLDGDLVRFQVAMTNAIEPSNVAAYAECAAAGYTLVRGYGFARHVKTEVDLVDGIWTGDAVYTISPSLPDGFIKIDAEVAAANCRENGIPLV